MAFVIEIFYNAAEAKAGLHAEYAGVCAVGGAVVLLGFQLSLSQDPPLQVEMFCVGTKPTGLHCLHEAAGTLIEAFVGPYLGPGTVAEFRVTSPFRLEGTFAAV